MSGGRKHTARNDSRRAVSLNGVDYRGATKEACPSGKWGWSPEHKAGARTLLKVLKKNGDKGARVYLCDACGRYHVGHQPRAVREGRVSAWEFYETESRTRLSKRLELEQRGKWPKGWRKPESG